MKRVVTLWHWTLPLWLVDGYGGWHNQKTVDFFVRYCEKVADFLGEEIDLLVVFNEPHLPLNRGYLKGDFPPGKKNNFWCYYQMRKNMLKAYKQVYDWAKSENKKFPIGITQFCVNFEFLGWNKMTRQIVEYLEDWYNWNFQKSIGKKQDFIGFNYYRTFELKLWPPFLKEKKERGLASDWGWGYYPKGIKELSLKAENIFNKPIYVFENGLADRDDKIRERYIRGHLGELWKAIEKGADVRGYFHWSLLDNFEWLEGYWPKFGLVEVDFETLKRTPRPSYYAYRKIILDNGLE